MRATRAADPDDGPTDIRDPTKALVPPEKALQLLSYDVHAEAYPVAREIARQSGNPAARREALRLLAADAASAPVFEEILRNKGEPSELRRLAASALHALAPQTLQARARDILLDDSETDDLKASSLTALTTFGQDDVVRKDDALRRQVDRLKTGSPSAKVKQGARRFLSRYDR